MTTLLSARVEQFGMVLYEVTLGKLPYTATERQKLIALASRVALDGYRPKIPREWNRELKGLIEKLWAQDVSMRPSFHRVTLALELMLGNATGTGASLSAEGDAAMAKKAREQSGGLQWFAALLGDKRSNGDAGVDIPSLRMQKRYHHSRSRARAIRSVSSRKSSTSRWRY